MRDCRIAAGLSQEALAEHAGLSINAISALERGYRRSPQRETLALLAQALKLNDQQRTVLLKDPFKAHDDRVERLIDSI